MDQIDTNPCEKNENQWLVNRLVFETSAKGGRGHGFAVHVKEPPSGPDGFVQISTVTHGYQKTPTYRKSRVPVLSYSARISSDSPESYRLILHPTCLSPYNITLNTF